MTCTIHKDTLLDIARGVPVDAAAGAALSAHVAECGACRSRLTTERHLTAGLRALARSADGAQVSSAIEARLLEAFGTMHPVEIPGAQGTARWRTWLTAAAAVLVMAGGLTSLVWSQRAAGVQPAPPPAAAVSEFVPWPGAASLPAFESGELMRTELPASALPLLGLVPAGNVTGNVVLADVLIGQDGLARAVRLVNF